MGTGRRLVLIRHAQAERETAVDKERRLDEQGREEASRAGRWLAGSGITPDLARVSGARRTRETWEAPRRPARLRGSEGCTVLVGSPQRVVGYRTGQPAG
ncbi:SixA phosphatase family protein [Kitasatospora sp. NPDC101235]|uniref:SixA phosphatase family protein n=1 Tax=Kitasatospora sp. NPDC101235 TaxID=3364101 RepID=UPI0037FB0AE6